MKRWVFIVAMSVLLAQAERKLSQAEFDAYNLVLQDLRGTDVAKSLADLDAWKQKFPASEYAPERTALYVQGHMAANQPGKALDVAAELIGKDLATVFPETAGPETVVRLLYNSVWAITQLADPTPAQLETGKKAAQELLIYDRPPAGVTPASWAEARAELRTKASAALLYAAMLPGSRAMAKQPPDCAAAEVAYQKTLAEFPEKSAVSWELGRALSCLAKLQPEKQSLAVYHYLRAAELDPTLGDKRNDRKKIETFATNAYIKLHGSDEGLKELRQQAQAALPTPDFRIVTAVELADAERIRQEKEHPEAALWSRIKATLTAPDGSQFFEAQMKDAAVPQLTGTLLEGKPACRPKELLVAVPSPDGTPGTSAEIRIVLDKPLTGTPELNTPITWEGVPSAFSPTPFLLTMATETEKVQGLKLTPCIIPRKPAARKP